MVLHDVSGAARARRKAECLQDTAYQQFNKVDPMMTHVRTRRLEGGRATHQLKPRGGFKGSATMVPAMMEALGGCTAKASGRCDSSW